MDEKFFEDIIVIDDGSSSGLENFDISIDIKSPIDDTIVGNQLLFRSFLHGEGKLTRISLHIDGDLTDLIDEDITITSGNPYEYEYYIDTRELVNGDHKMELRIVPMDRSNIFIAERVDVYVNNVDYEQVLTDVHLNINDVVAISGDTIRFQVHCYDQFGSLIPYNDLAIIWQIIGPIGDIDDTGLFTADSPGKTRITVNVQYGGKSYMDVANVTIYPVQNLGGSDDTDQLGILPGISIQSLVLGIMVLMLIIILAMSGYIFKNRSQDQNDDQVVPGIVIEGPPEPYPIQQIVEPTIPELPVYTPPVTHPTVVHVPLQNDPAFQMPAEPSLDDEMDMYEEEDFNDEFDDDFHGDDDFVDPSKFSDEDDPEVKELMELLDDLSDDTF